MGEGVGVREVAAEAVHAAAVKADRREQAQREFNRSIFGVLVVGILVLVALGGIITWLAVQTREFNAWVDHTYEVQSKIMALQNTVERGETARRGYLLSPIPAQLATYQSARSDLSRQLFDVAVYTQDNPVQREGVSKLRPLLAWKTKVNDDSIDQVKAGHRTEAILAYPAEQALQPLIGIRKVLGAMMDEERRLLVIRRDNEDGAIRFLAITAIVAAVLLGVLSLVSILAMRRFASDLVTVQSELRVANEGLEQRVLDRTTDLTRANEEIQRFAYIVSHDLRSPLVNVMGFTSELEAAMKPLRALIAWIEERDTEGRLPKEVKTAIDADIPEAIGFIRSSTRKMDSLIGAILKLSREGRRVLNPERLPMEAVAESLLANVKHRLDGLGGDAVVEGEIPDIVSDRLAVEQVLGNLVDNAVKYHSPARPLRITLRGGEQAGRVWFEVQDNGRGVDPKDHERIFELFRRSGVQNQPGEGIGLAHVRALAHRLGGTVTCVSALDQGATFRLSLPKFLLLEGSAA